MYLLASLFDCLFLLPAPVSVPVQACIHIHICQLLASFPYLSICLLSCVNCVWPCLVVCFCLWWICASASYVPVLVWDFLCTSVDICVCLCLCVCLCNHLFVRVCISVSVYICLCTAVSVSAYLSFDIVGKIEQLVLLVLNSSIMHLIYCMNWQNLLYCAEP